MKLSQFNFIAQILTLVSVLAGLALVIYELQETRRLVQIQVTAETLSEMSQERSARYGERLAEARALACTNPSQLSLADRYRMADFFHNQMNRAAGFKLANDIADFGNDWKYQARSAANVIRSYPGGEDFLKRATAWDPEFKGFIDELIATEPPFNCKGLTVIFDTEPQ